MSRTADHVFASHTHEERSHVIRFIWLYGIVNNNQGLNYNGPPQIPPSRSPYFIKLICTRIIITEKKFLGKILKHKFFKFPRKRYSNSEKSKASRGFFSDATAMMPDATLQLYDTPPPRNNCAVAAALAYPRYPAPGTPN